MRVIAGSYRGRRLQAPPGKTTRPTSDRVKEALFAMLGDIAGTRVLDLFAGTGALGIEAVSRGALQAVFVEHDRRASDALQANLAALGLGEPQAQLRREPVDAALKQAQKRKETYDLVLVDPPYGRASEVLAGLTSALAGLLAPGARVVVESDRRTPYELGLALGRERRYGDTEIRMYLNT